VLNVFILCTVQVCPRQEAPPSAIATFATVEELSLLLAVGRWISLDLYVHRAA